MYLYQDKKLKDGIIFLRVRSKRW